MKRIILAVVLIVIFVTDMLTGRAIMNGLDSLIPRAPIPHPTPHRVDIKMANGKTISRDIWCEDYYDAQGGSRGNFWAVRERGMTSVSDASREKCAIEGVGVVSFVMPTCAELSTGGGFGVSQMVLLINGVIYGHKSSDGDSHTFIPRHAHEGKDVTLDFTATLDGRAIR